MKGQHNIQQILFASERRRRFEVVQENEKQINLVCEIQGSWIFVSKHKDRSKRQQVLLPLLISITNSHKPHLFPSQNRSHYHKFAASRSSLDRSKLFSRSHEIEVRKCWLVFFLGREARWWLLLLSCCLEEC